MWAFVVAAVFWLVILAGFGRWAWRWSSPADSNSGGR
jgi:hypothetical protein